MFDDLFSVMLETAAREFEGPAVELFDTPGDLAKVIDPRTIQTPALDIIDDALSELMSTPDGRLIISMPPQEGKSTRVSRDFPIWALQQNPELRIITASYAQGLANRNGRSIRNAITSTPQTGLTIAGDHGAASEWSLAGHGGGVLSVGRGAGVTGRPADLLIIDDPLKDRAEAESKTIRDTCWDWWTDALSARLAPGAPVVVIMTRWHEDDLAGRLVSLDNEAGWKVLNIPAQCEDPLTDPLGRDLGEFMVSARGRTTEQWEQRKATAGARTWASLFQGRPSPENGNLFMRDNIHEYSEPFDPTGWTFIQSWDLSFNGGKNSDYVVGQVWAKKGRMHRLVDQVRGRWGFPETIDQMRKMRNNWPNAATVLVEAKANGSAAIDTLKREGMTGIVPINPRESKINRATAVTPLWEAGDVEIPSPRLAPWSQSVIEELVSFPNGAHDDQVDAAVQALAYLTPSNVNINRTYSF